MYYVITLDSSTTNFLPPPPPRGEGENTNIVVSNILDSSSYVSLPPSWGEGEGSKSCVLDTTLVSTLIGGFGGNPPINSSV